MKSLSNRYDLILKNDFLADNGYKEKDYFPYTISKGKRNRGKEYECYFKAERLDSKGDFRLLLERKTKKQCRTGLDAYCKGDGGELKEKAGRYGHVPPKFLSVGSSSNFCFTAIRMDDDGPEEVGAAFLAKKISGEEVLEYDFEKKLEILPELTRKANLDAYIKTENTDIYIECKCHEFLAGISTNCKGSFLLRDTYFIKFPSFKAFPRPKLANR